MNTSTSTAVHTTVHDSRLRYRYIFVNDLVHAFLFVEIAWRAIYGTYSLLYR